MTKEQEIKLKKADKKKKNKYTLETSLNKTINIIYNRTKYSEWNFTGLVTKVRKGSILLRLNDEKTVSIGYGNITHIEIIK